MAIDAGRGDDPRLPCGRDTATVYEHLHADCLDPHEQACPHCQDAARALAPVLKEARALAIQQPRPPAGFTQAVMTRVRAELGYPRYLPLPAAPGFPLAITEHAAATIMAEAASTVPGVTGRGARFPVAGDPGHVVISITARYRMPLHRTAGQVRRAVRRHAQVYLGIRLRLIDITIDDILP